MTRISDILVKVRDSLSDPDQERWSQDRLLRILDEGQKDIARHSKLLKGTTTISLAEGQFMYDLPDDLWLIRRATFDNCAIELVSYDEMDEFSKKLSVSRRAVSSEDYRYRNNYSIDYNQAFCWEDDIANEIAALVYDNRNMQEIRVYPVPGDGIGLNTYTFQNSGYLDTVIYEGSPYGVLTGLPDDEVGAIIDALGVATDADSLIFLITDPDSCNGVTLVDDVPFNSDFGVLAEIEDNLRVVGFHGDELLGVVASIDDYTSDSPFGIVGSLFDPDISLENFLSPYGVLTSATESSDAITVYYVRTPNTVTSIESTLEIPSMYDAALRYYTIAHAYSDDNDAGFQEKSAGFFQLYNRELEVAINTARSDGTKSPRARTTTYRGPFE